MSDEHVSWISETKPACLPSGWLTLSTLLPPQLRVETQNWSTEGNIVDFRMDDRWNSAVCKGSPLTEKHLRIAWDITHVPATAWVTQLLSLWLIFNSRVCTFPGHSSLPAMSCYCMAVNLKFKNKVLSRAEKIDPVEFAEVRRCKASLNKLVKLSVQHNPCKYLTKSTLTVFSAGAKQCQSE